jgi:hypothetical protein
MKAEELEALEANLPTIEFFYNKLQNAYSIAQSHQLVL